MREEESLRRTLASEADYRGALLARTAPLLAELEGRESELAWLLGAKRAAGGGAMLKDLNDNAFRVGHPASSLHLPKLFPELVSLFRTANGPDYREFASFVRSVLVRGGVAPRRILSEPFRLRVAGV